MEKFDFDAMYEKALKKVKEDIKNIEKLIKENVFDSEKYNLRYLVNKKENGLNIYENSLSETIKILTDEQERYKDINLIGFTQYLDISNGYYDGSSPDVSIINKWYEYIPLTEKQITNFALDDVNHAFGNLIFKRAKELNPEIKYKTLVDCKMATLFKDDKIDFDTLVELTYTNCKI